MASLNNYNFAYGGILAPGPTYCIDRIMFDGVKRVFPLGHKPTTIMSAHLDGGTTLSIGWAGLGGTFAVHDAIINVTVQPPTIEFPSVPPKGKYADISYQYDPGVDAKVTPRVANEDLPLVPGWEEWDYQNYRDFATAVHKDMPVEFALCQWLMQQENTTIVFNDEQWSAWYRFARSHCERFDKSEPAWKK